MLRKNDNISKYFGFYKNKKYILNKQDIKQDYSDLASKSLNFKNYVKNSLSKYIPKDGLFISQLLLFLREVRFNE